jgi:hypothetical protein
VSWRQSLIAAMIIPLALSARTTAQVSIREEHGVYALENPHLRLEIDPAAGGRIRSWRLKPSGRDLIALWNGANEIGGALDDRASFTAAPYDAAVVQAGPETAVLRLEARNPSGVSVLKTIAFGKDSPAIEVGYEFRNGTLAPHQPFIRSFLLPGEKPQTKEHLYWVHADPASGRKPVEGDPDASEYYQPAAPEFAALWDRRSGDGVLAFVPGVERFYFWRGSQEFPTFEWLYPAVPPGRVLRAGLVLVSVSGAKTAPDWKALAVAQEARARKPSLAALSAWVDEATRFRVTEDERRRGFWFSAGSEEGKQRLPDSIPLDLPQEEDRYIAITLNVTRDQETAVHVDVPPASRGLVEAFWETSGQDRQELLPLPSRPIALKSGAQKPVWLRVDSHGVPPGHHPISFGLGVGENVRVVTIALHVWPVRVAQTRPFHVRGYYSGLAGMARGFEVTANGLGDLEALLKAYAEMGGDVLDWLCNWAEVVPRTRIAGTGENLAQVAKTAPERIDLNHLPKLDFSYYDPWFDLARRHGVVRLETYMSPLADPLWQSALLDPAVGAGRVKAGTPEAGRVIAWFYAETKRYLQDKGFQGFFCKISDEISPESVPSYIDTARIAREAGWRPFTTVTGMVARTAEYIRAMNPYCDQWQLGFGSKDDFLGLLRNRFQVEEKHVPLQGRWLPYTNGNTEATWAMRVFGEDGATRMDPKQIEKVELLEDGRPLVFSGDSPWGNKRRGVVLSAGSLGDHLYVSPHDGADPSTHRYELRVSLRHESPQGAPLAGIDATDELWFYGGAAYPFRGSYAEAWGYPILALAQGFHGYGLWAFYWWQTTERIVCLDERTHAVTVSPAYCGYRDGWRDALLFNQLIAQKGRGTYGRIVGAAQDATLHIGWRQAEVYNFTTLTNAGDPLAVNTARRAALEQLAGK